MDTKERLIRFRSFWIFPLLAVALILVASRFEPHGLPALLSFWAVGVLAWTLLEYVLHRFVFHARMRNGWLRDIVNLAHARHHAAPRNPDVILVQTTFGLSVSALIFGLLFLLTGLFYAAAILIGIWTGFLYYEAVHYRAHMSLASSRVLQRQRRAHFYHHFSDSETCFGVTTPLWDYVFGTVRRA